MDASPTHSCQRSGADSSTVSGLCGVASPALHQLVELIAQELYIPLAAASLTTEALLSEITRLRVDQAWLLARHLQRRAACLATIIDNLTTEAQIDRNGIQLSREAVNLRECVEAALAAAQPWLDHRQQRSQVECPASVTVWGDPRRIRQILGNVLVNASQYGEPATVIRVTVSRQGELARIQVDNRGPGILPGEQERIFERYVQGSAARETSSSGVGLGLHIVKTLVECHGGRVGVESAPGNGASVWFTLPRWSGLPAAAGPACRGRASSPPRGGAPS